MQLRTHDNSEYAKNHQEKVEHIRSVVEILQAEHRKLQQALNDKNRDEQSFYYQPRKVSVVALVSQSFLNTHVNRAQQDNNGNADIE